VLVGKAHGFLTGLCLPHDHHVYLVLEGTAKPVPYHLVIIHKDEADLVHGLTGPRDAPPEETV
jgi:hypothetical protein